MKAFAKTDVGKQRDTNEDFYYQCGLAYYKNEDYDNAIENFEQSIEIYDNDELINCIKNINDVEIQYKDKYDAFYNKFCGIGHGTASEEVINAIFEEVNNV